MGRGLGCTCGVAESVGAESGAYDNGPGPERRDRDDRRHIDRGLVRQAAVAERLGHERSGKVMSRRPAPISRGAAPRQLEGRLALSRQIGFSEFTIRPGSGLARGLPACRQRRSGGWRCRVGDGAGAIGRLLRILAARQSRLDHPPRRASRRLRPLDRFGCPVQRAEHGVANQLASPSVVAR